MKKLTPLTLGLLLSVAFIAPAMAESNDISTPPSINIPTTQAESIPSSITSETKLSKLQAKGAKLMSQRLDALNKLKTKFTASKLLDDQKTSLSAIIDTNVSGLTTLSDKIKSETDLANVKILVKSIYSDFRIYGVVIPKLHLMNGVYVLQNHIKNLNDVVLPKMQTKIDNLKAKGKDVTEKQSALDAIKTALPTIQTKLVELLTTATNLKVADYPATSKTTINSVKSDLKTIREQLKTLVKMPKGNRDK